jgi:hypothetical protein
MVLACSGRSGGWSGLGCTAFVEDVAHVGIFKSRQRRKIATGALKFAPCRESTRGHFHPQLRRRSGDESGHRWAKTVVDHHEIELGAVQIPDHLLAKPATVQANQSRIETSGLGEAEPLE